MTTRYFLFHKYPNYQNKPRVYKEITRAEYIAMGRSTDTVWITVDVLVETVKAFRVSDSKTAAWLPKSLIEDSEEDIREGHRAKIEVPIWWAEQEGMTT